MARQTQPLTRDARAPHYDLSVIVPVHNEAGSIEKVLRDISGKILSQFPGTAEVVVAEDGSTDGTKELLACLQPELGFRLVSGNERKGYNRALKDALSLARGKHVFLSDSGGGHEMSDFLLMYPFATEFEVVSGFKKERKDPAHRIVLSRMYNRFVSLLFRHIFYDIDSGFKMYQKEALDQVLAQVGTLQECISTEIVLRMFHNGCKVKEIPVTHYQRNFVGPAKTFTYRKLPRIVGRLFWDLLKLRKELKSSSLSKKALHPAGIISNSSPKGPPSP